MIGSHWEIFWNISWIQVLGKLAFDSSLLGTLFSEVLGIEFFTFLTSFERIRESFYRFFNYEAKIKMIIAKFTQYCVLYSWLAWLIGWFHFKLNFWQNFCRRFCFWQRFEWKIEYLKRMIGKNVVSKRKLLKDRKCLLFAIVISITRKKLCHFKDILIVSTTIPRNFSLKTATILWKVIKREEKEKWFWSPSNFPPKKRRKSKHVQNNQKRISVGSPK